MRAGAWCASLSCGAALVGSVACSDGRADVGSPRPIQGCESFSYAACDILSDSCQRELFGLMACLRGEADPGEPPSVRSLAPEAAVALIAGENEAASGAMSDGLEQMARLAPDDRAFVAQVRGLELLGLIDAGQIQDRTDLVDASVSALVAYYLVPTGEIVIIDRGEPIADLDANAVLAHELVHALQDRRHGLGTLGGDAVLTSDGALALASLVEGEASLYQDLFMLAAQGAALETFDFEGFYLDVSGYGTRQTLAAGSPLLTAPSIFPYTHGSRYAAERWVRGGAAGLSALFTDPPRTSLEVLGGTGPITAWGPASAPLEGYALAGDDTAGAWISVAMLGGLLRGGAPPQLPRLARRWRGDRLWVHATTDEPPAVIAAWAIDWEDAAAAAEFADLAATFAPAGASVAFDTTGHSTRLCVSERADALEACRAWLADAAPPAP